MHKKLKFLLWDFYWGYFSFCGTKLFICSNFNALKFNLVKKQVAKILLGVICIRVPHVLMKLKDFEKKM